MIATYQHVLPDHLRLAALAEFPEPDWSWWHRYGNGKLATVDPSRIPSACLLALHELARTLPPLAGSFWDVDCYGAGLHLMPRGTSLGQHLDAESHPIKPWRRVASMVYFLEDCDGGELVVDGQEPVEPEDNLAVLFAANQWHRVDEVRSTRRTLSLFAWAIDNGPKARTSALFTEVD